MGLFDRVRNAFRGSADRPVEGSVTVTEVTEMTLEAMEAEAVSMVMKANTGTGLHNLLNRVVIFLFKTFAPFAVLALTVPESIWVFTHLYTHADQQLTFLTGVFAVLVDFGYLYLTVLLAMNKEAIAQRQRAGVVVEPHERGAVRFQTLLWWFVAPMDTLAQIVFLYSATKDSHFFAYTLVMVLVGVRVFSLFMTMFVVSFAGTELMTSVDRVTNQQIEQANAIGRVMAAMGTSRMVRQRAASALQEEIDEQNLRKEGQALLAEVYSDARENVRRRLRAPEPSANGGGKSGASKLG